MRGHRQRWKISQIQTKNPSLSPAVRAFADWDGQCRARVRGGPPCRRPDTALRRLWRGRSEGAGCRQLADVRCRHLPMVRCNPARNNSPGPRSPLRGAHHYTSRQDRVLAGYAVPQRGASFSRASTGRVGGPLAPMGGAGGWRPAQTAGIGRAPWAAVAVITSAALMVQWRSLDQAAQVEARKLVL